MSTYGLRQQENATTEKLICTWHIINIIHNFLWNNYKVRQTTKQPHLLATVLGSTAFLPVEPDKTDAKILTAFPLENWRRPPGRPCTTWMKAIWQDLQSNNLFLNEAIDMAQNRPLWRLMSMFGTMHF